MSLRNSRFWDREFESGLPDCRLQAKPTVVHGGRLWEMVYCADCGEPYGLVTAEFSAHVFYVCELCVKRKGAPPGVKEIRPS